MYGIRYVVEECRQDVMRTRKDGSQGKLRIDYGKPSDSTVGEAAVKWLWKFVDGAKTAAELYGRGLVVIAAEHYASQLVVPNSQRGFQHSWGSHKGHAVKALERLAGPHVPASLKAIEKAVKQANAGFDRLVNAERGRQRAERDARQQTGDSGEGADAPTANEVDEDARVAEDDGDADQLGER